MRPLTSSETLLQSLGITEPEEIDLEAIAWDQGAEIRYRELDGCEARIVGAGDKAVISIHKYSQDRRQRFSIGHELGHWHHHRGKSFICRSEDIGNYAGVNVTNDAEKTADRYSADLLLPLYIFKEVVKQYKQPTYKTIFSIADLFGVSKTCTAIRYVEHGNFPCILICHDQSGRKWFKRNKDVPDKLFPRKDMDHESGAFDVLYGQQDKTARTVVPGDTWFDWRMADRYEVWEETFQARQGETLTLLTWQNEEMLEQAEEY